MIYPTMIIRKGLLYSLSDQLNDFNLRTRLKASALDSLFPVDEKLSYEPLIVKAGEMHTWKDLRLTLAGIDKNIDHPNYKAVDGDIAIQAVISIESADHKTRIARPLYFIRDGSPLNMKAYLPDIGLHIKLERIDPEKEEFFIE